ncbi:glycerophosphodiester phosphodiesterase, partial [Streptomyces sp. SID6137]|nr:glycerophosphodiester phosphodiesterase [Streptomyces sp. SID6137]
MGTERTNETQPQTQVTGRRALLGAAMLGASGAVLGLSGTARAAEATAAKRTARGLKGL